MPTDDLKVLNVARFTDLGLQENLALNASGAGQGRIRRIDSAQQKTRRHTLRHAHALWGGNLGNRSAGAADNAAQNAAHLSTRNATRNAAYHTGSHHRRRRLVFRNHLYFLWNLGRGTQLTVDDIGLYLLHDVYR